MIVFGLFFGLMFLPVMLSIFGGDPNPKGDYEQDEEDSKSDQTKDVESILLNDLNNPS